MERSPLTLRSHSEGIEDRLLTFSDKVRSFAESEPTSMDSKLPVLSWLIWNIGRGEWYSDYLSMLSQLHVQQCTYIPISEYPQTLQWLFSHDTYLAWLGTTDPCILHIYGQCGVGKTTLSSFMWKSLHAAGQAQEDDTTTALYFSFDWDDKCRISAKGLLSSMIYQLLKYRPQNFLSIKSHFDWIRRSWPLTVEESWIIFRSLISRSVNGTIICIIDAIDLCDVPLAITLQEMLAFSTSRGIKFKVVATSRIPPDSLHYQLLFCIDLDFQREIRMDMEVSIRVGVCDLLSADATFLEYEDEIVEEFQKRRTHLELILGFEYLKISTLRSTPSCIQDTLQCSGSIQSRLCDHILHKAPTIPPWARIALSWIVHAFRPLTPNELSVAIAIRETTTSYSEIENEVPHHIARDLKHYFGGILSCKHDKIRFIHQSVKDYLLVHLRSPNRSGVALDLTHADLARLCLAYLSLDDFKYNLAWKRVKASSRGCSSPGKFDLLGYAAEYWPRHYQRAEPGEHFSDVVLDFIGNGGFEETRNETRPHKWEPVTYHPRCPLQIAAKLGLADIVTTVLSQHSDNGTTQNDKEAALDMAVESGQLEIAVQLLNDGITSEKALRLAARHGNNEIVEQLLYKSDMEALKTAGTSESDRIPEHDDLSPLHIAALRGHTAVIGTLLEAGFTLKPVNTSGDTPFNLAVKGGQLAALQQLLVVDDTIALADRTHRSLLHLAAREGHLEIVRELVAGGADANAFGTSMSTPLLQAVEGGHEVLVRDLIHDFGADLKAADEVGSCAVHIAAVNGYTRVLEQLCKAEADVKAKDRSGSQPIHLASEKGHLRVTKRLLELGVDPNTVDGRELTPLHLAARGGHLRVVQELLKHPRISLNTFPYTKPKSRTGTGGLDRKSRLENEDYEGPERDNEDALTKDSPKFHADYPAVNAEKVDQNSDEFDYDSTEDESFDESSDGLSASRLLDVNEATPLHSAAVKGYAEIVRELLKAGTRCNICSKLNVTPLHLAAQEGYVSVVKELLNHNADPNIADDNQSSPLHAASITGNLSVVEKLLKFGADVSKADDEQVSPLHHASRHGHVDVVRHLLGAGAELGATNADTQTPLHIAVRQRHCNVVAELLARGANPGTKSGQGWTALHFAVSGECIRTDLIMQIIQGGMDIHASNDNGSTALFLAAESGSEAAVETLLRAGAKADAKNAASSTPMHRAAQEGHVYVVKLLMEAGAHPFAKKRRDITPLQLALGNRHLDVAIQLLEPMKPNLPSVDDYEESLHALARVGFGEGIMKVFKYRLRNLEKKDSKYQQSALSHAAENGHDGVVQMLLAHGADPNSTDKSGRTPLSWAVINRHQAVAEQLLKRGANVRSKDHDQWTALHLAIQDFNLEMVNLLLNAGADVSAPLNGMIMPLHLAAQYDEPRIIQLLVKKGASLSSRDSNQFTPLDHAVRLASVSTVEALLDLGAGHAPPTSDGLTALYWAMDREDDSIVDLLVRRCSDTFVGQQGWKKLHLAALSGNKYSARELLEQGADMDARDQSGLMALHWAAARSHEDVVRILLDMGREIQAKDNEGMTALHHAASRGNERTVMALLKMGAERNVTDLHGWTPLQIAQVYVNDHVCDTLSGEDEATIIPGARSGLAPSRWVKAIDSPATTISEDGLTVIAGK